MQILELTVVPLVQYIIWSYSMLILYVLFSLILFTFRAVEYIKADLNPVSH